ncbi:MAG: DUF1553 domain-containing protein [Bryobacterales bacterium]|nr:DUF1553 domain-containing protein [Bryobacterales bacterium]
MLRSCFPRMVLAAIPLALLSPIGAGERGITAADCNFLLHQDEFHAAQSRLRGEAQSKARRFDRAAAPGVSVDPRSIGRSNLIDTHIFDKLQGLQVRSAPLASDEEFLRRATLDLTGRIPAPEAVREFLANPDPAKREALIDALLQSPEFTDKWTWWLGDLLQNNVTATNVNRGVNGRNAFHSWIKAKVEERTSLKDIAWECVTGSGTSYFLENGASNFVINSITPGGPVQDQYDAMASKTATAFLGLGYLDCLLCHNGRGHLDALSLWGKNGTRMEALRMAAFFSRQNIANHPESGTRESFFAGARIVTDRTAGNYALNTTNGNRPARCAPGAGVNNNRCSATLNIEPEYLFTGAKPSARQTWREAFADSMTADPMFARNLANRLWKEMFNLGLVDPVDTMDPARLDPSNPPPDGWQLQATHPELLEALAAELRATNFNMRAFLKLIANSSAYQLSSRYGDDWKLDYVPLFARHFPRRLEGEEVHDAITKATGALPAYTVQNMPGVFQWAMQLPDPAEPRSNGAVATFMNAFLRGNRDSQQRSQSGSILQRLYLMNDNFVTSRVKVAASPNLRALANRNDPAAVAEDIYLLFLGRKPSDAERRESSAFLARATTQAARNTAVEDLAWALINKVEFIHSY